MSDLVGDRPKAISIGSSGIQYLRGGKPSRPAVLERSRFAHLLHKNGVYCFYHALTLRMVYGGPVLKRLFEQFADSVPVEAALKECSKGDSPAVVKQIVDDLWENRLLVQGPAEEARLYHSIYSEGVKRLDVHQMYLLPTSACNFRCQYCFVEDSQRQLTPRYMTKAIAEMALTVFARLSRNARRPMVTIYGGEPLLARGTTLFALRFIRQLEAEGKFAHGVIIALLTNGSLIDDEVIRVLKETRTGVGVSIDGPQQLHDAARKQVDGSGTFAAALRGYQNLQNAGLNPSVSCTVNGYTVEHMDEIVDFIISDLKPRDISFNLLLPRIGKQDECSKLDHEFAVRQLIKAFERLREANISEDRVMRRIRPFVAQQPHLKDCMGVGGQIVVTPTGRVGFCQAYQGLDEHKYFPLGVRQLAAKGDQLSAADIYSHPLFNEWRYRFPFNMSECADCFAISVCGGGCPYAAEVTSGSIWEIDKRVCHQAKNILEWMIWDTYDHMAGDARQPS